MTLDELLTNPALPLLVSLERRGCEVFFVETGRLRIRRANRLTRHELAEAHRLAVPLKQLVRLCDSDVQARRQHFATQLADAEPPRVPILVFRPAIPYVPGRCFSCADPLETPRFGRCWRCSLAWRLALDVTAVSPDAARAYLEAGRVE